MVSSKDPNKQKITQLCKNVEFILPKFPRFKTGYPCFRSFCYCRELLRNTGLKGLTEISIAESTPSTTNSHALTWLSFQSRETLLKAFHSE